MVKKKKKGPAPSSAVRLVYVHRSTCGVCSVSDPPFALSFLFANCVKRFIGLSCFCDLL